MQKVEGFSWPVDDWCQNPPPGKQREGLVEGAPDDLLERLHAGVAHIHDLLVDAHDERRVRVSDEVHRAARSAAWCSEDLRGNERHLPRGHSGGSAASDADALAIADKGAARGQRSGAAGARPERAAAEACLRRPLVRGSSSGAGKAGDRCVSSNRVRRAYQESDGVIRSKVRVPCLGAPGLAELVGAPGLVNRQTLATSDAARRRRAFSRPGLPSQLGE
jgi:hypothetical protein